MSVIFYCRICQNSHSSPIYLFVCLLLVGVHQIFPLSSNGLCTHIIEVSVLCYYIMWIWILYWIVAKVINHFLFSKNKIYNLRKNRFSKNFELKLSINGLTETSEAWNIRFLWTCFRLAWAVNNVAHKEGNFSKKNDSSILNRSWRWWCCWCSWHWWRWYVMLCSNLLILQFWLTIWY